MKLRKVVSLFAAAAMAVSNFAGLATTASAAESEIVVYSLDRTDYDYTVLSGGTDGVDAGTTVNGLGYIGALSADSSGASYTYTDVNGSETTYNFTKSWKGGQGSTSRRCLYFTPKSACKVTAVFKGSQAARNMTIYQSADKTITQEGTNSVVGFSLEVTDTTTPVYVYGGSSNKNLYAVIVEYYGESTEPSINLSSSAQTIIVGNTVDITATTENADGVEVNWTSSDDGIASVENGTVTGVSAGTATITAMINVDGTEYSASCEVTVVNTGTVSFTASGAEGSAPEAITANNGESITLPINRTLYVDGSTLTGWSDGTTTYAPGASYTVNGDATLTAVFEENTVALGDAEATVAFDLQTKNGTPVVGWQNRTGDILVYQASINGTSIDVKMNVDTTNGGKVANANWTDWAQVNGGTTFTVPAVEGAVVKMDTIYNDATYTINGTEYSQTGQSQGEDVTITGAEEIAIVAGSTSGSYWRGFSVTYPQVESTEEPEETEAPAETEAPSTEATSKTTVITADEMTGVGNSNGNPVMLSATATDATDAYVSTYQDIFGVDFANITTNKYGYLGDSSRGHLETTFTTTADGECTLDVLVSYARSSNLITVTDSDGNVILDAVSPTQSEKLGTNGQDLYVYTATIDNLPAGTYTFKWHSASYCSDFLALAVTCMSAGEAEATPTPEPDATDVMPDFAYQFANTNSTELTSTTSGTYYLDKDGKICDSASNQTVTLTNVRYHNSHGLYSNSGATYKFRAKAPFKVTVGTCTFDDGSGKLVVKDTSGNTLYESDTVTFNDACYISSSSNVVEFSYTGTGVVDVTFSTPSGCYFPYIAKTSIDTDTISGALTGAEGLNEGTITFTSQTTGNVYTGTIANGSYSVVVPTGDTYDVLLTDCDYVAVTTYTANGDNSSADITCAAASYQSVSGTIVNPPSSEFVLTFTKGDGTTSTATVAAGSTTYVTSLLPGVYTVTSSTGTLSTLSQESFQVIGSAVTKNLYYPETIPTATSKTVTVYPDQAVSGTNYHTIADAVAGIKAAGYSESTILLKSGATYQEQVRIQINGVTLKTDGEEKATITWYYGIGYTYYSLGADGYYDKDRAMTKVGKLERDPDRWGAVVRVTGNNFTAENIIFENSFNQRFTEEEVSDGVVYNGCQSITVDRVNPTVAADSRTATERAAAIAIEGTGVELYNCEFIGSQDTFFTGGTAYVKDCAITGNTDYIFGGGSIVFDNCDLIWGGYSDAAVGGYITASNGSDAGYLFRDCTIKDGNRQKAKGAFGRDWGGTNAHAYFINCTDATEKGVSGWSNMGGAVSAGTADLHVYDLSNPAAYTTYGTSDAYNITEFTFEDAKAYYEGALDTIGFTPAKGINAVTKTEALDGVADETKNDYVYGVLTEITAGSDIAVSGVTWTVKDANKKTYTFSTNDSVDGVNMLSKGTFPTITGGGTATISMLFHAPQGTYEVASQAE